MGKRGRNEQEAGEALPVVRELAKRYRAKHAKIAEKDVVRACLDYLKLRGILAWRNQTGMYRGTYKGKTWVARQGILGSADIIACVPKKVEATVSRLGQMYSTTFNLGILWAIECKGSRGGQSDAQKAFEAEVRRCGGRYVVVRSVADLEEALK